jgi:hypothetical protein
MLERDIWRTADRENDVSGKETRQIAFWTSDIDSIQIFDALNISCFCGDEPILDQSFFRSRLEASGDTCLGKNKSSHKPWDIADSLSANH